jgi:hypothetical protein
MDTDVVVKTVQRRVVATDNCLLVHLWDCWCQQLHHISHSTEPLSCDSSASWHTAAYAVQALFVPDVQDHILFLALVSIICTIFLRDVLCKR